MQSPHYEAKAILNRPMMLKKRIFLQEKMLENLKDELERFTHFLTCTKVQVSRRTDFTDILADIEKCENDLKKTIHEYSQERTKILMLIDTMNDDLQRAVLIHHYINFYNVLQIAEIMEYSERHIQRLLQKGILSFEIEIDKLKIG